MNFYASALINKTPVLTKLNEVWRRRRVVRAKSRAEWVKRARLVAGPGLAGGVVGGGERRSIMHAGRELDALVAEKLLGIKKLYYEERDTDKKYPRYIPSGKPWRTHRIDAHPLPRYSIYIGDAWEVVDKLIAIKYGVLVGFYRGQWSVQITDNGNLVVTHEADTAPLAICLAALQAVEHDT